MQRPLRWQPLVSVLLWASVATCFQGPIEPSCRCMPGDACWPTPSEWEQFNRTLGGKLIGTVPLASVCHVDPFAPYNAQDCERLRSVWGYPATHYSSSSSIMASFFANHSCDPFLPKEARCILGSYVQYAVNVTDASDVQKTLHFTTARNIRLVIRNTGHDLLGKSTGAGAVGLWMHHLKQIQVVDYQAPYYEGKAIKVGAGVQAFEVNTAAFQHNLVVVGGNCPSIGQAGGYSQGGGHGQLVSRVGLAADQVLEWEVVTADVSVVVASPTQHADLYWALAGGGGGTYGVVLSMTAKAYPELPTVSGNLTFSDEGAFRERFFAAVEMFISLLPSIGEAGGASIWWLSNTSFSMTPATIPGGTIELFSSLFRPLWTFLDQSGIAYAHYEKEFSTYFDSYQTMTPAQNITDELLGGRFIPRSVVKQNCSVLVDAFRSIVETDSDLILSGITVNASRATFPDNAVNPAWRETIISATIGAPFDYTDWSCNLANHQLITKILLPRLERLTPGGGAYLNEGDWQQPNWQRVFYGDHYDRLREIKNRYDPQHIFYGLKAVGSEVWTETADGRLCRVPLGQVCAAR